MLRSCEALEWFCLFLEVGERAAAAPQLSCLHSVPGPMGPVGCLAASGSEIQPRQRRPTPAYFPAFSARDSFVTRASTFSSTTSSTSSFRLQIRKLHPFLPSTLLLADCHRLSARYSALQIRDDAITAGIACRSLPFQELHQLSPTFFRCSDNLQISEMAASATQSAPKASKKKLANAIERVNSPAPSAGSGAAADSQDEGYESPYIKELQKYTTIPRPYNLPQALD